nr:integrase, catalytic region, zinc finger, CCHC-type, peptidase aspartic, catalytic [Tanacetum cinerariifolium]
MCALQLGLALLLRKSKSTNPVSKSKVIKAVVKIFLWYLDSGCSKHMTRDRSQLTNFVNKFFGTVKFRNDHVAKIMGYGDYQIGNVMILRVYYMEGLGHNLFFVGQFCDSNLEVAFLQHTCFIRNLEGIDLLTGSQGNNCKGPTSESSAKKKGRTVVITIEDMQKRRNDIKARTTLLLALSDEHRLRFSKKNTENLNTKISKLNEELSDCETDLCHYKRGLSQVEARLVEFKEHEIKFCERIRGLERDVEIRDNKIEYLKNELERVKKEKESLDNKLTGFENASKDLDNLLGSQTSDKNKEGLGYNVVPPPSCTSLFTS